MENNKEVIMDGRFKYPTEYKNHGAPPYNREDNRPHEQWRIYFDNGYGASIITGWGAYSSHQGEYELAVLKDGSLCYDSGLTDDVIGHITIDEVNDYLDKIKALPIIFKEQKGGE